MMTAPTTRIPLVGHFPKGLLEALAFVCQITGRCCVDLSDKNVLYQSQSAQTSSYIDIWFKLIFLLIECYTLLANTD